MVLIDWSHWSLCSVSLLTDACSLIAGNHQRSSLCDVYVAKDIRNSCNWWSEVLTLAAGFPVLLHFLCYCLPGCLSHVRWLGILDIRCVCSGSAAKRPVGIIEVKIIRARNLVKKDFMGKSDPYVKIQLVNTVLSKTTRTKMSTLNPEWNETFKLLVQDPKSQSLELQVYDWEKV